jgi:tRNA(His) 5'-end guanylyltransferase
VIGYYFQSRVEDCQRRNEQRPAKQQVPLRGILGTAGRMELPATKPAGSWSRGGKMKFDELDDRMRVFETALDLCVLPGIYMVARLDGRSFTRLTKEVHPFEAPFDPRFRDYMLQTAEHLMAGCGFKVVYGYTQSDEISLLFALEEDSFQRKLRKLLSVLSGEASAKFSLLLGDAATFDCRISQLPSLEYVVDYFRWRNEDAHRNALNAHCYWFLRKQGRGVGEATAALKGLSVAGKNELLFQNGINFNDLFLWQRRGSGLYWEECERPGENPVTGEKVVARRRRLYRNLELPMKEEYSAFLRELMSRRTHAGG